MFRLIAVACSSSIRLTEHVLSIPRAPFCRDSVASCVNPWDAFPAVAWFWVQTIASTSSNGGTDVITPARIRRPRKFNLFNKASSLHYPCYRRDLRGK